MQLSERGAFWVDIFLFSAISVFIYQLGLIYFLFAVPLQILIKKRGSMPTSTLLFWYLSVRSSPRSSVPEVWKTQIFGG